MTFLHDLGLILVGGSVVGAALLLAYQQWQIRWHWQQDEDDYEITPRWDRVKR